MFVFYILSFFLAWGLSLLGAFGLQRCCIFELWEMGLFNEIAEYTQVAQANGSDFSLRIQVVIGDIN